MDDWFICFLKSKPVIFKNGFKEAGIKFTMLYPAIFLVANYIIYFSIIMYIAINNFNIYVHSCMLNSYNRCIIVIQVYIW